jgi:hypothetical protein
MEVGIASILASDEAVTRDDAFAIAGSTTTLDEGLGEAEVAAELPDKGTMEASAPVPVPEPVPTAMEGAAETFAPFSLPESAPTADVLALLLTAAAAEEAVPEGVATTALVTVAMTLGDDAHRKRVSKSGHPFEFSEFRQWQPSPDA